MRNNEARIFVFIASIIIGVLAAMNISFKRENKIVFLSSKEYHNAYAYRNQILNGISDLNEQYKKYYDKLSKYTYSVKNKENMLAEIKSEIGENKDIIGFTELQGEGIKIYLEDADGEFIEDPDERRLKIIHDRDVVLLVNDLLNAGAEAVSINGLRVVGRSSIMCNGPFLRINGIQVRGPFYINAIGNKEVLKNYMTSDEAYVRSLMLRGIEVEIEESKKVEIPAYNGELKNNYVKSVKE